MKQLSVLLLFLIVSFTVTGFSRDIKIIKVGEWGNGEYEYEDVFIRGKYAYCAASEAGLEILNVGNPYSPYQVGNYETAGGAFGIDVKDNYAYVAAGKGGLQVIDITRPYNPIPVGTADLNLAYADKLYVRDNYVYVCAYDGLKVIDISTPSSPTLLLNFDINGIPSGISFQGDFAYISTWVVQYTQQVPGMHILDISNPNAPQLVGVYDNGYTGDSFGIAVRGNYAYLVSYSSLVVVDISNPISPFEVYIAAFDAGIKVIDVSDPTSPTLAASFEVPGDARDIHIKDDYIYAADGDSGKLLILKVHHRIPPNHLPRRRDLKLACYY